MLQNNFDLNNALMSEKWHKPYAMALMEKDLSKLKGWVAAAEKAIFARYLELRTEDGSEIQFRDLYRATEELRQLKSERSVNKALYMPAAILQSNN